MKVNHNKYRLFDYVNNPDKGDAFILGDVVHKRDSDEIGVIIQCHGNDEYRTDKFGNCCYEEGTGDILIAHIDTIKRLRPEIIIDVNRTKKLDLSKTKRQDNTVELIDDRMTLKKNDTMFYPDEPYRSITLSNEGQRQVLVNGEIFSGEEFDKEFKVKLNKKPIGRMK
jgi:hypothetical protein